MAKSGINWKRTIDRFGWYALGIALGCLLVGLMIRAKAAYLGPKGTTPASAETSTPGTQPLTQPDSAR